ncbi:MAG: radical SAM protein [Solirubrobacterales bacterium]
MNQKITLMFCNNKHVIKRNEKTLLANKTKGTWMIISSECFNYLNEFINSNSNLEEIRRSFNHEDDRKYFSYMIDKLITAHLIYKSNEPEEKEIPESANLILTERCNLSCLHCCQAAQVAYDNSNVDTTDSLNKYEIFEIIDKLVKMNLSNLTITGGEPLIRKDFWDIAKYLRNIFDGKITLLTNGLLINESNIKMLIECFDSVSVSIDGVDREMTKLIRGVDIHEIIISKVRLLKKYGMENVSLSSVLPNNANLRKEFEGKCNELGVKPIIRVLSFTGRADENKEILKKEIKQYLIRRSFKDDSLKLDLKETNNFLMNDKCASIISCGAARRQITVGSDGSIYPCNMLQDKEYNLGNIKNVEKLVEFLESKELLENKGYIQFVKLYGFKISNRCSNCDVNIFCHFCLKDYKNFDENDFEFDMYCKNTKNRLTEIVWGG